jgi:hypothetical protein
MAQVLFYLNVLCVIGMLVIPATSPSKGDAVLGWFTQLIAAVWFSYVRDEYFPSWGEPRWHSGIVWPLASWAFLIIGFVVAIRKPRKRNTTVA